MFTSLRTRYGYLNVVVSGYERIGMLVNISISRFLNISKHKNL